jgi:ubiquinone biosynthesis protein
MPDDGRDLGPQRFASRLVRLGPLFVKIGQYLALRPDILPQSYCDELLRLTDRVPPVPWPEIQAVLERELGGPVDQVFAHIRRKPLAAGSIAQVHLARTHDRRLVAVKIQRPDLAAQIDRSLRWSRVIAQLLEFTEIGRGVSPGEVVSEIERWLRRELDFRQELNSQLLLRASASHRWLRIPEPLPEVSTERVFTAEYLQGVPFSELIAERRLRDSASFGRRGFDRELLAERLITTTFHQMFSSGRFHADPHPGNLIAMPGNVIGLVDCGLTDSVTPVLREAQAAYLAALSNRDAAGMHRALTGVLEFGPDSDPTAFRQDFIAETNDFLARNGDPSNGEGSTSGYMIVLMRLARVHRARLPTALLSMYRALLTVEAVARQLGTTVDLGSVGRSFFAGSEVERLLATLEPATVINWLTRLGELGRSAPGQLQELLADLVDGRFVLSTQTRQAPGDRRLANRRARLIALAILALGPAIMLAGHPPPVLADLLWAVLGVLWAGLAWLWWRLK